MVDLSRRNQCQSCRFSKCLSVNMRREGTITLPQFTCGPVPIILLIDEHGITRIHLRNGHISFITPAVQHERAPRSCAPMSSFGMDFGRPSAFAPGSFFMPLPIHFQAHSASNPAIASPPLHTYFAGSPAAPYIDTSSRVSLLSERLFGRMLLSPTGSGSVEEFKESLAIAKEDEVTSSEAPESVSQAHTRYNKDAIFESAAKLLFMAVKFAKNIPSFSNLPLDDRTILIKESWADLFVLTCAQWNFVETSELEWIIFDNFTKFTTYLLRFPCWTGMYGQAATCV